MAFLFESLRGYATRVQDRQQAANDTVVYNQRTCFGWNWITGDGVSTNISKTITLPITYDDTDGPVPFATIIGYKAGSNPSDITDLTAIRSYIVGVEVVSTSSIKVIIGDYDNNALTNNRRIAFSWMTIGTYNDYPDLRTTSV